MGRERNLFAEDRIRAEGKERWRRRELAINMANGPAQIEERPTDEATEEELQKYKPRSLEDEVRERERRNREILEARREAELAASDEREMPLDPEVQ